MILRRTSGTALAIAAVAGCVVDPGLDRPLPVGDAAAYAAEVQPELAQSCANPACHGRSDRPLALYAPTQHRADPDRLYLDEPLTEAELAANRVGVAGLLVGFEDAEDSPLLTRPLAPAEGGSEHGGGTLWHDRAEPGYVAVHGWAQDAIDAAEGP